MESLITRANTKCPSLFQYPLHLVTPSQSWKPLYIPDLAFPPTWISMIEWIDAFWSSKQAYKLGYNSFREWFLHQTSWTNLKRVPSPNSKDKFYWKVSHFTQYSSKSYTHEVLSLSLKFNCHIPPHITYQSPVSIDVLHLSQNVLTPSPVVNRAWLKLLKVVV